jgi:hypothetical protein
MQQILSDQWLTSDPIDFEYKKYLLLAYEQKMMKEYQKKKVYPSLTDIVDKLKYVNDFLKSANIFEKSSMSIKKIDWLKKELQYESNIQDDMFDDLKLTTILARNILSDLYLQFKNLYDEVDDSIMITGSKFTIFDKYDGYLLVKYDKGKKEKIMKYDIYKVLHPEPEFRLKTAKASMKEYYTERFMKNIFEVTLNDEFPTKASSIPVFRRKFLLHVMGNYIL